MPRPKGSPNKITSIVKDKLQLLIDDLTLLLDVNELDANQSHIIFSKLYNTLY